MSMNSRTLNAGLGSLVSAACKTKENYFFTILKSAGSLNLAQIWQSLLSKIFPKHPNLWLSCAAAEP